MSETTLATRLNAARKACGFALVLAALTTSYAAQSGADKRTVFDLQIENNRLTKNQKVIMVRRGDAVELKWSADRPTTLHLHGYDIEIKVDRGRPETMTFVARATGRFAIEMHSPSGAGSAGRHRALIYLEVHPR